MSKKEIFIFRHGETDWNRTRRFQGHSDIPLNEAGRQQALLLAEKIERLRPEVILSSDLCRARETAEIVNQRLRLPVHVSDQLRETRLGDLEGRFRDDALKLYSAEIWEKWASIHPEDLNFSFPNGETKRAMLARMRTFIEGFSLSNTFGKIAVSTHGGSMRAMIYACAGAPAELLHFPNCALFRIFFDLRTGEWSYGGVEE